MIFRTMRADELEAFVTHCVGVFAGGSYEVPAEFFRDHYLYDPHRNLAGMFVAEDEGRIVSFSQVFTREMYVHGQPVRVGGIGDVATLEAYRRQGLSGRLLEMCITFMQENDIPISTLYTDKHQHYGRYGWFTVANRKLSVNLREVDGLPADCLLLPLEAADLPEAERLYHLCAPTLDGAFTRRHPKYWSEWVPHYLQRPVALKRDGQMLAWMDTCVDEGALVLIDYGAQPGEDWFFPMLAEVARREDAPDAPQVARVPAPLLPKRNGPFVEQRDTMYRLNRPFMLAGERIDEPGKLAAALSNALLWQTDMY